MKVANARILVVANECFSKNSSNGRTLMNLLGCIPSENIAQFYIHGAPDNSVTNYYFGISDRDVISAFLHRKSSVQNSSTNESERISEGRTIKKNCKNRYLRDVLWSTNIWWKENFSLFLDEFRPSIVLLQAGDMPYMFDLARRISNKYNAKLMMYNSEGYVLKKYMYNSIKGFNFWHILLKRRLLHSYKRFMKNVDYCIYSTEYLEECYQSRFPHPNKSSTFYTISDFDVLEDRSYEKQFSLLYCGNLGVGRIEALDTVAKILFKVSPYARLRVYGSFINEDDKSILLNNLNVDYCGFISYEDVPNVMSTSSVILHCENSSRVENLRYAFSTKIADCLASGRPFLVYANEAYPFVAYLKRNSCCHIACDEIELEELLRLCINSKGFRCKHHSNALVTAKANHSREISNSRLLSIIDHI